MWSVFSGFLKESKTNFSKQFVTDLSAVLKDISSYLCHSTTAYLPLLFCKVLWKNCYESLHLMDILGGNDTHPPLYLYMYHMFFSPYRGVFLFFSIESAILSIPILSLCALYLSFARALLYRLLFTSTM